MAKKSVKRTVKKKPAIGKSDAKKQWEYETYSVSLENDVPDFHNKLDSLGEKGWGISGSVTQRAFRTSNFQVAPRLGMTIASVPVMQLIGPQRRHQAILVAPWRVL
jgi:hypothetical protein